MSGNVLYFLRIPGIGTKLLLQPSGLESKFGRTKYHDRVFKRDIVKSSPYCWGRCLLCAG